MKAPTPIVAGCVALAALVFTAPKSASATTAAAPAVHYGKTYAGMIQEVGRRWRGRRYVRPYYGYGYTPYYRPYYGYGYRPYYRPYAYYGYGYPYWRPGLSFGFAF
jgi:hypothetical protein